MKADAYSRVEKLTRDLNLDNDALNKVSSLLLHEFNMGLGRETNADAKVKMFPTFVRDVPNGKEHGKFLALDLGGTNFRVLLIDIDGDRFHMESEIYAIPQQIMLGSGAQLFDRIAECLANFMDKFQVKHLRLPLGFTFSFPCSQEGLTVAKLVQWTKGFNCDGVVGRDVVELLRQAIKRRADIDIDVMAVVNDTAGTLMSCAHKNRECRVGVIVGTGTNACYMETIENAPLFDPKKEIDPELDIEPDQVIINTEWGAFGDNNCLDFLRTKYDDMVDNISLNKGKQLFEKMISGMYMGELVRCVLIDLVKANLLFNGQTSKKLQTAFEFQTAYVSWIESDTKNSYNQTNRVLTELELIDHATVEDKEIIKLVCGRVSTRAAYLVSAAITCILKKMKRPYTTVGVDGSVYRFHPHFHDLMEKKIAELLCGTDYKFSLMLSEDGSGRGAALVAAVAVRHKKKLLHVIERRRLQGSPMRQISQEYKDY